MATGLGSSRTRTIDHMEPELVAALATSIASLLIALASGALTVIAQRNERETQRELAFLTSRLQMEAEEAKRKAEEAKREREAEAVLNRYRESLASAAYELHLRLYNILEMAFLEAFGKAEHDRGSEAVTTTLYRIAVYFAWTEVLQREIQFLEFLEDEERLKIIQLQDRVSRTFNTDTYRDEYPEFSLMIWRDVQRAIGELMIQDRGGRTIVLGYAEFLRDYDNFSPWLGRTEKALQAGKASSSRRLVDVQHTLVELLEYLDKRGRFDPSNLRLAKR
jgi:hypothetical protein